MGKYSDKLAFFLQEYGIKYKDYELIDSSRGDNDTRLNYIIDKKYVLRINDQKLISETKLKEIDDLCLRYESIGLLTPSLLKTTKDTYSFIYEDKIIYLSKYLNYPSSEELNLNTSKEMAYYLGKLASLYSDKYLCQHNSMWSLIDLAPLDNKVDEKQENADELICELEEIDSILAKQIKEFNLNNREKIKEVYKELPRCVYQGDLNSSNILIDNNKVIGLIDFNLFGTEVNINCFLNETNCLNVDLIKEKEVNEVYTLAISKQDELMDIVFENYKLNEKEKRVYENYRNITLLFQYPTVSALISYLNSEYKEKALELIRLIISH